MKNNSLRLFCLVASLLTLMISCSQKGGNQNGDKNYPDSMSTVNELKTILQTGQIDGKLGRMLRERGVKENTNTYIQTKSAFSYASQLIQAIELQEESDRAERAKDTLYKFAITAFFGAVNEQKDTTSKKENGKKPQKK